MTRLAAGFWVRAYLARLGREAIPAYIAVSGDSESGAVIVKVATMDGFCRAYQRSFDLLQDRRVWVLLGEGPESDMDEKLKRQAANDPDLWIVEIEDPAGRHLLDEDGLEG